MLLLVEHVCCYETKGIFDWGDLPCIRLLASSGRIATDRLKYSQSIHSSFPGNLTNVQWTAVAKWSHFFKMVIIRLFLRIMTTLASAVICSRVGTTWNCLLSSLHELGDYLSPQQFKWYAMGEQSHSRLPVIQPLRDQQNWSYYLAGWTK